MSRTIRVLERLPAHLVATRPGKLLGDATTAVAAPLDHLATELAGVRRSHRIAHADTIRDVLLIGGIHDIAGPDLEMVEVVEDGIASAAAELEAAAGGPADVRDEAAVRLLDLWGVEPGESPLDPFAPAVPEGESPDHEAAALALAGAARATLAHAARLARLKARVLTVARIHVRGNGTLAALMEGAANALDLDLDLARNARQKTLLLETGEPPSFTQLVADDFFHSRDLFWHGTFVRTRLPLVRSVPVPVDPPVVTVGVGLTIFDLATTLDVEPADVLATAVDLGLDIPDVDTPIDEAAAEQLAVAHGGAVARPIAGTLTIEGPIAAGLLARRLGVRSADVVSRLEPVDGEPADADALVPLDAAAVIARRFGTELRQRLEPAHDVLGIEENPLRREEREQVDTSHGHRWTVLRRGFGETTLRAEVEGLEDRTVGPMLVDRDAGHGFGWFGTVPDGAILSFEEDGDVLLDGEDAGDRAFSWRGAVFANSREHHVRDFVFPITSIDDERWARFVVATPSGALDRDAEYPHDGEPIELPEVRVGATRMAFFVQVGRLSSREGSPEEPVVRRVTPHPFIGFADRSVFAATPDPAGPPGGVLPPGYPVAARVALSWLEHEAYALRVVIPARFRLLDEGAAEGETVADRVGRALERFRPAGVEIRVEHVDDRWILGQGAVVSEAGPDPISLLRGGTVLWPEPEEPG